MSPGHVHRRGWVLRGVVQGVGFRPHVARVAARHPVSGFVGNDDSQVFVEVQGAESDLDAFMAEVVDTLPALASVVDQHWSEIPAVGDEDGFRIVASRHVPGQRSLVPPDVATCDDCLREMADPSDRRHRHPFITCTNCGPRLSIIRDLPYDRPVTTMVDFPMCPECAAEYTDPDNRRFHAQPISCWTCGPALWLVESGSGQDQRAVTTAPDRSREAQLAAVAEAGRRLRAGQVVAVKGIGGFHLVCDARNDEAVTRLRERKRKSGKPFAVLVRDLDSARGLVRLDETLERVLASPARPIVIAPMAADHGLSPQVAPGLADLGVMLAYAPIHQLLLDELDVLVATSGNAADEPLCSDNADALERLAHLADAFLLHDRGIHVPVEDSVVLAPTAGSGAIPVRRSRGYAPLPVVLPTGDGPVVLGVGGEWKNTFTLATGDMAFVSAHLGDMGSWASQQAFEASVAQLVEIHRDQPTRIVCDLHPDYATTAWAERYAAAHPEVELIAVQHHWAHALSLLAEHRIAAGPVVVAAVDGTGYGPDRTIWGGEVITLGEDLTAWTRSWHVPTFDLVGGDRAIRHPWRIARGLCHAWGFAAPDPGACASGGLPSSEAIRTEMALVDSQLASGFGVVKTSSLGRFFDAACSILGICQQATYEAQAAMELERVARTGRPGPTRPSGLDEVLDDLLGARGSVADKARRFHDGVAWVLAEVLDGAARDAGTDLVGLTGGVVMNRLLTGSLVGELRRRGLRVLTHRTVPPNDGGLSLGQAYAGRLLSARPTSVAAAVD